MTGAEQYRLRQGRLPMILVWILRFEALAGLMLASFLLLGQRRVVEGSSQRKIVNGAVTLNIALFGSILVLSAIDGSRSLLTDRIRFTLGCQILVFGGMASILSAFCLMASRTATFEAGLATTGGLLPHIPFIGPLSAILYLRSSRKKRRAGQLPDSS